MIIFFKNVLPYIRPYLSKAIGVAILALFLAGIKGYQITLVKPIFDKGLNPESSFSEVLFLAGLLFVLALANFPIRFFHFYWIRFIEENVMCELRQEMFSKFQSLPMSFYAKHKQGKLISNLFNDSVVFANGFRSMIDIIREPLTALVMLGVAFYHDWQLTLVMVIVTPVFTVLFVISGRLVKKYQHIVQEQMSNMIHAASEGIEGQKITKAFNLQDYILKRFGNIQKIFLQSKFKTITIEEISHPLIELIVAFVLGLVIILAYFRIKSGELSVGGFVSFIAALAMVMEPIRKYSSANIKLHQAQTGAQRIFDILGQDQEVDTGEEKLTSFTQKIEVKNISFSYGEGDILSDVSFEVNKGQKIAFVGLSGSGKSTLLNLFLGLYRPQKGEILIDGIPLLKIDLKHLRDLFGLVSQDIFLFNDTILENLTVGKDISKDELHKALEVSYSNEFIDKLPDGMNTIIGDRGARLSGGQKQRLTIARAFLNNNDILLFDEATSALDNESEQIVQKALDRIVSDKTVIAVAHRLSTISNYDKIFVLKDGKIVEQGSHKDLIGLNGQYAKLYQLSLKT